MSLPLYILIYFAGQRVHNGGEKLGFSDNFVNNCRKGALMWCVMV